MKYRFFVQCENQNPSYPTIHAHAFCMLIFQSYLEGEENCQQYDGTLISWRWEQRWAQTQEWACSLTKRSHATGIKK